MDSNDPSQWPTESFHFGQLAPEQLRKVDQLCYVFESQLNTGRRPQIEDFLERMEEPVRSVLFQELLRLEVGWQLRQGLPLCSEDYRNRFPEFARLVGEVFRKPWPEPAPTPEPAWPVIPNYHIQKRVGHGAMGTVFRAVHTWLCNDAAIKVLQKDLISNAEAVERFRREMRALGSLSHANIVAARDAGESQGIYYLVMEYVEGLDLSQIVRRLGPLPVPDACEIARRAARALQHAHEHNLVHRDIKPSNLLLGHPPGNPDDVELKVADLGVARLRSQAMLQRVVAHERAGTVLYMAPEQYFSPATADIRADVYGLGCTLYEFLLGQPPFDAPTYQTRLEVMLAHRDTPVPSLRSLRPDVSGPLEETLLWMMAKNPSERFQTPGEVADSLAAFRDGHDLVALLRRAQVERPLLPNRAPEDRSEPPSQAVPPTISPRDGLQETQPPRKPPEDR